MPAQSQFAPNGGRNSEPARELAAQGERIVQDLRALANSLRYVADDWQALLRDRLERHPYATIAIALGAGYVLGGGLPRGVSRTLLSMAAAQALQHAVPSVANGGAGADEHNF